MHHYRDNRRRLYRYTDGRSPSQHVGCCCEDRQHRYSHERDNFTAIEEPSTAASFSRKPCAFSSVGTKEAIVFQHEAVTGSEKRPRKKPTGSEYLLDAIDKDDLPSSANVIILSSSEDVSDNTVSQIHEASEDGMENIRNKEKLKVTGSSVEGQVIDDNGAGINDVKIIVDGHLWGLLDNHENYKLNQMTSKH